MAVPGVPSFQDKLVAMLPRLRVHALSLTRNRASADDLVHDTVCNALAAQSTYVHDTNFAAWMHLILRNRFISNGRKRRETSDIDDVPAKFLATEPTNGRRLEIQELDTALQRLRPNQRQALLMVAIDGLSYEALAESIGCALGTAKSRVFRARRQLELALAGDAPCSGDDRRGSGRTAVAGARPERALKRDRAPVRAATPLPPVVSNAPEVTPRLPAFVGGSVRTQPNQTRSSLPMKSVAIAIAAGLMATAAVAQTTTPAPSSAPVVTTTPGAPVPAAPGTDTSTGTTTGAGVVDRNTGTAAAAGNQNQAVTTTSANAPQPAKGANSFTAGEARGRLESEGYSTVSDLKKDNDGIWRGTATKNGASVGVWLDYKGNIGQQ